MEGVLLKKAIIGIIVAVVLVAVGFGAAMYVNSTSQPSIKLSADTVQEQLSHSSELATAKLEYRGLVTYEEGDIDFINKKKFTMIYDAEVRVGVDLSQAKVEINERDITVTLPQAGLLSVSIDSDSIDFYDESFALFNWQNRSDTAEALNLAADDAENKVDQTGMIEEANEQARLVVENFLLPFTEGKDGYTLTIITAQQ